MKVMSKSKEYMAIKVYSGAEFFLTVGRYVNPDNYEIVEPNEHYLAPKFILKINNRKIDVNSGDYILIDTANNEIEYVEEKKFKENYVELKGEE